MKINLTHWPIMRLIRLAVAIGCFIAYFRGGEWFILMIGIIALLQTILNVGCADGSCEIPENKSIN